MLSEAAVFYAQSIVLKNTLAKLMIGSLRSRAVNVGNCKKLQLMLKEETTHLAF